MTQKTSLPKEELIRIEDGTNEDGTLTAEIIGVEKAGEQVNVQYQLPSGRTKTETMPWPEKATDEYQFVRLVRDCGFSLSSADHIVEQRVPYEDGSLSISGSADTEDGGVEKAFVWLWMLLSGVLVVFLHNFWFYETVQMPSGAFRVFFATVFALTGLAWFVLTVGLLDDIFCIVEEQI